MNQEERVKISEHTENGVRLANFIFYGLIVLPIFNIAIFFDPTSNLDFIQTMNFFVLFVTLVLAVITIFNTLRFYEFYRNHENPNALYSKLDIIICYILPFIEIYRIPKMFTEVVKKGFDGKLTTEAEQIKRIILFTYFITIAFYLSIYFKQDTIKLIIVAISTAFGFYSGFYYAIQIRKIYMLQNAKALDVELMRD
jgi:hypothetical protein